MSRRLALLAWVVVILAFQGFGFFFADGYRLDLGSLMFPTPKYLGLVSSWIIFGSIASLLLMRAFQASGHKSVSQPARPSDLAIVIAGMAAAFIGPILIRRFLLDSAPLTDDESAYTFAAQLLERGRLWIPSPPDKIFFDQNMVINDGHFYTVYFLGWPALLALGRSLHVPSLLNPTLFALTIPPFFLVLERMCGRTWAAAGVALLVSSPFLQVGAATELSHTACLMALTWALYFCYRLYDRHALPLHAGLALSIGVAFFIRPQATLPLAVPLCLAWAWRMKTLRASERVAGAVAFLIPAGVVAGLFFWTLAHQTGSATTSAYTQYWEYIASNDFRFSTYSAADLEWSNGFSSRMLLFSMVSAFGGFLRLNTDLFGWPCSLLFLPFAWRSGSADRRLLWWMLGLGVSALMLQRDWGVDTFGPVHAFELALPVTVLTVVGARELARVTSANAHGVTVSAATISALILTAWVGFVPVRLRAIHQIANHVNVPLRAPERAGLHNAVIFSPLPFAPPCGSVPNHFVFFHPVNHPDMAGDILWVNDLGDEANRRMLEHLPGRIPFTLEWSNCSVRLVRMPSS